MLKLLRNKFNRYTKQLDENLPIYISSGYEFCTEVETTPANHETFIKRDK